MGKVNGNRNGNMTTRWGFGLHRNQQGLGGETCSEKGASPRVACLDVKNADNGLQSYAIICHKFLCLKISRIHRCQNGGRNFMNKFCEGGSTTSTSQDFYHKWQEQKLRELSKQITTGNLSWHHAYKYYYSIHTYYININVHAKNLHKFASFCCKFMNIMDHKYYVTYSIYCSGMT